MRAMTPSTVNGLPELATYSLSASERPRSGLLHRASRPLRSVPVRRVAAWRTRLRRWTARYLRLGPCGGVRGCRYPRPSCFAPQLPAPTRRRAPANLNSSPPSPSTTVPVGRSLPQSTHQLAHIAQNVPDGDGIVCLGQGPSTWQVRRNCARALARSPQRCRPRQSRHMLPDADHGPAQTLKMRRRCACRVFGWLQVSPSTSQHCWLGASRVPGRNARSNRPQTPRPWRG